MKKILFLLTMCLSVIGLSAQKYDDVKKFLALNKYKEAKVELDKNWTTAKFTSKPEAYMLKAAILAGLAMSEENKGTASGDAMTVEADEAFNKYKEMDPTLALVVDPFYQTAPVNIYSSYYTSGYNDYTGKKWQSGFDKFKRAVEYSDLLFDKKVFQSALDTNVLILAGIMAENSKNKDAAVKYYTRLADKKVTGDGFESVYRYLVSHYFAANDMVSFEKYKGYGRELYPKSDFFTYDKVDFGVGLVEKFEEKLVAMEKLLATDPNNMKANQVLAEVIYDELNPRDDSATLPQNFAELEGKMVVAFNKSATANPASELPYLYLGDHYINKAVRANKEREMHAADMKARTKPGTMASKEDLAKRDALDKKYGEELEKAREPYEKAAAIFAARATLDGRDKPQYKKAVSYLADIYSWKKIQAKGKPADQAKYAAEEKKWNDKWESIK